MDCAGEDRGGFAKSAYDNVGIQYGLEALLSGEITPEQFVDLNEKIGGEDIDHNLQAARSVADPGRSRPRTSSGRINDATQLDKVAIIDLRGTSNEARHPHRLPHVRDEGAPRQGERRARQPDHLVVRTRRADRADTDAGDREKSFLLLDRWLSAVEADTSSDPLETKIVRDKPADAVDSCFIAEHQVTDMNVCRAAFPYFGAPRIEAGGPLRTTS